MAGANFAATCGEAFRQGAYMAEVRPGETGVKYFAAQVRTGAGRDSSNGLRRRIPGPVSRYIFYGGRCARDTKGLSSAGSSRFSPATYLSVLRRTGRLA